MKQFEYTINDPLGIHARPAGMLVKEAKAFADTVVTITKNGTTAKAGQLMKLMSLGVKQGDVVTVAAVSYTHLDVYKRQIYRSSAIS